MFLRNGAIYATRRACCSTARSRAHDSRAWVMPEALSVNIDTEHDFRRAEWLLAEGLERP